MTSNARSLRNIVFATSILVWTCALAHAGGTGTVSGVVTAAGSPLPGARVTVYQQSLFFFAEQRTAADGSYFFDDVPVGRKFLGVAARGFEYEESLIDVSSFPWVQNFTLEPETHPGSWDVIGNTLPELFDATDIGILLDDGTVFYCHDTVDPIRFDPVTGTKTLPAGSGVEQGCMNGTLLEDGRIIMVGGQTPSDPGAFMNAIPWVKTHDLVADAWTLLPDMQHEPGRWYPGLARLADGSLLVMGGGQSPDASRTDTCETFDLQTETWEYTGTMLNPTEFPPSTLLYTGEVLATWSPPQLYEPVEGQWRATGDFVQPARGWPGHSDHSIVVMADGRVLALGVRGAGLGYTAMGEIYDPATEQWTATSSPDLVRFQSEIVQLPDGRVLAAGGETEADPPPVKDVLGIVTWCDLYDPAVDQWRRVDDLDWYREYHAVTLLVPDGRVLTTGGTRIKFQFGPTSADIEAFSPPYLFRGVRPEITSISSVEPRRGETLTLEIAPATTLTSVVAMGSETTTHWVDGGVHRRLLLDVEQVGSTVQVSFPADPNVAPLGRYLVFAMVDDIPSVARIVNLRPMLGDVNGDGVVAFGDLLALLAAWGTCDSCPEDLNGDGEVGFADLLLLLSNWS